MKNNTICSAEHGGACFDPSPWQLATGHYIPEEHISVSISLLLDGWLFVAFGVHCHNIVIVVVSTRHEGKVHSNYLLSFHPLNGMNIVVYADFCCFLSAKFSF